MLLRLRRRLGARGSAAVLVLATFLLTRALVIGATHAGAATMNEERREAWKWKPWSTRPLPAPAFLDPLQRWDADYYTQLAVRGYPPPDARRPLYPVGFFPLYPLAVRAVTALTGNVF